MKFQNLIEKVFKLLLADRFPRKTEGVLGGNKPRSSIEMELMKAPRKSISLPQTKGPLSKALDCIKQSMGSVEQKDGSYPMPSTVAQDWLPSKSDINKLVKLKYYQSHEELIPTATASALDPDANRLDISLSYPVKVSSLQSLEGQSRTTGCHYMCHPYNINRCHLDGLESHTRLCVSTVSSHSNCDKQNTDIPVQNSIDSSFMARQTMVSRTPRSVGVTTGISASNAKSACSAKRQNSASKSRSSTTSRLGIVKQSLRDKQFSSEVAEHVSKARRDTTVKVNDAKWQIFRDWANERKIDPIQATPQIVADFLTFLFSVKKCQVSTIRGYRSTISNTLKFRTGYDFGSHPVLSELIKSFAKQRPVDRSLAPKWDLAFVLSHMCKAPFEPLDKASLFHLSVKTVFLVTLATARRVSEVHAFSIDSDHLRFSNLDGSAP